MLSKAQIKHITALRTKKFRTEHSQFFVEGKKSIQELCKSSFAVNQLYFTPENKSFAQALNYENPTEISAIAYSKISNQKQPEGICAIVKIPTPAPLNVDNKRIIALDKIRDPGNLGTIIRIADWFGIYGIVCSPDCVDAYNNKVIQASMGSIFSTKIWYQDLQSVLEKTSALKFAAVLDGDSVYNIEAPEASILVIGNEANGISKNILDLCTERITIPAGGQAESLNAAMACGILSSYLFR